MQKFTIIPYLIVLIIWALNATESISHLYRYEVSLNIMKNFTEIQLLYESKKEECDKRYERMENETLFNAINAGKELNDRLKMVWRNLEQLKGWKSYSMSNEYHGKADQLVFAAMLADENVNKCRTRHLQEVGQTKNATVMEMKSAVIGLNNTLSELIDKEVECMSHLEDSEKHNLSIDNQFVISCIEQIRGLANFKSNETATHIRKSAQDFQDYHVSHNSTFDSCVENDAVKPYDNVLHQIIDQITTSILALMDTVRKNY